MPAAVPAISIYLHALTAPSRPTHAPSSSQSSTSSSTMEDVKVAAAPARPAMSARSKSQPTPALLPPDASSSSSRFRKKHQPQLLPSSPPPPPKPAHLQSEPFPSSSAAPTPRSDEAKQLQEVLALPMASTTPTTYLPAAPPPPPSRRLSKSLASRPAHMRAPSPASSHPAILGFNIAASATPATIKRVSTRLHTVASTATAKYAPTIIDVSRIWGRKGKETVDQLGLRAFATGTRRGASNHSATSAGTVSEDEVLPSGRVAVAAGAGPKTSTAANLYSTDNGSSGTLAVKLPAVVFGIKVPNRRGLVFGQPIPAAVEAAHIYGSKPARSGSRSMPGKSTSVNKHHSPSSSLQLRQHPDVEIEQVLSSQAKAHLPIIAVRCIEYLSEWARVEEGIFRVPGRSKDVERLRVIFDSGCDVDLLKYPADALDPHAVASVFKLWLREIPGSILSSKAEVQIDELFRQHTGSRAVLTQGLGTFPPSSPMSAGTSSTSTQTLVELLSDTFSIALPPENWYLLRAIAAHLACLVRHSDTNRMTLSNLRLILSPTLRLTMPFLELLVEERKELFGKGCQTINLEGSSLSRLPSTEILNVGSSGQEETLADSASPHGWSPFSSLTQTSISAGWAARSFDSLATTLQMQPSHNASSVTLPLPKSDSSSFSYSGRRVPSSVTTTSPTTPTSSTRTSRTPIADQFRRSVFGQVQDVTQPQIPTSAPPTVSSFKAKPYVPLRSGTGWSTARAGTDERPAVQRGGSGSSLRRVGTKTLKHLFEPNHRRQREDDSEAQIGVLTRELETSPPFAQEEERRKSTCSSMTQSSALTGDSMSRFTTKSITSHQSNFFSNVVLNGGGQDVTFPQQQQQQQQQHHQQQSPHHHAASIPIAWAGSCSFNSPNLTTCSSSSRTGSITSFPTFPTEINTTRDSTHIWSSASSINTNTTSTSTSFVQKSNSSNSSSGGGGGGGTPVSQSIQYFNSFQQS